MRGPEKMQGFAGANENANDGLPAAGSAVMTNTAPIGSAGVGSSGGVWRR